MANARVCGVPQGQGLGFRIRFYQAAALDLLRFLHGRYESPISARTRDAGKIRDLKSGPSLFLTAHFHNWELMGAWMTRQGIPLVSAARPMAQGISQFLLVRLRDRHGMKVLFGGIPRRALRHVRKGGCFGLLWDQRVPTLSSESGSASESQAPLFGRTLSLDPLPRFLTRHASLPVYFGVLLPGGRFRVIQIATPRTQAARLSIPARIAPAPRSVFPLGALHSTPNGALSEASLPGPSVPRPSDPALLDPALLDPALLDPALLDPALLDPGLLDSTPLDSSPRDSLPMHLHPSVFPGNSFREPFPDSHRDPKPVSGMNVQSSPAPSLSDSSPESISGSYPDSSNPDSSNPDRSNPDRSNQGMSNLGASIPGSDPVLYPKDRVSNPAFRMEATSPVPLPDPLPLDPFLPIPGRVLQANPSQGQDSDPSLEPGARPDETYRLARRYHRVLECLVRAYPTYWYGLAHRRFLG